MDFIKQKYGTWWKVLYKDRDYRIELHSSVFKLFKLENNVHWMPKGHFNSLEEIQLHLETA